MRRLVVACLAVCALLAGCGTTGTGSPLQVTDTLVAARPDRSPPTGTAPAGTVLPGPPADLSAFDPATHTLVLAGADRPALTLIDPRAPEQRSRTIALPSPAAGLHLTGGTVLAALPDHGSVARVDLRSGSVEHTAVPNRPVDAVETNGRLVVARQGSKDIAVLDGGTLVRTIGGFNGPARLLRQSRQEVLVLDRLATSLTPVNIVTGDKGAALRAGEGATHAVTDRYGRALTVDTRGGEFLAFATDPLILKQRYPVSGSPFGLTYDPTRDLAWITLTARNELVAYDVAGGQPEEKHRLPTVRQPEAVSVDPDTGTVYVASATGRGIQVVTV
ncbi:hypothetical protein DFQ14_102428 [Halopolyspora algeriensis]|uniref:DNA-binding beta-propeller fold protein YncE n=1 Tax=Halopolyspora algeriensis TaxID=1500506 RepID=A0A368VVK3_9ACTN|nr:hypothetical protein [Halopolyspora algeriensis]RCW46126.1 hypothetical protein DFQ14_102428 [Halopolyspora algeriensis]TQM55529.1 hypothetical protein FHU43_0303 [Halopolyspora algeriensis]